MSAAAGALPGPPAAGASAVPDDAPVPWLGITAVLLGTFISTLTGRLSSFGLADIRGEVHAGFDDGAWITTAQTTAQMLITPFAIWGGRIYGPRQILLLACSVFAVAETLAPLSPNLPTLLALQFVSGLASGCFIPLTLSYLLVRMPRRLWSYGMAAYGLNIDLSTHVSASLEGWYVDHGHWRWIFWQNVPLAVGMAVCLYLGLRMPQPAPPPGKTDVFGLVAFGAGFALIYAALDQGNRLDWLNSGLVRGLIYGGAALLVAFYIHARRSPNSWLDIKATVAYPLPILFLLIMILRCALLATAFLVPQFLGTVRGFRALQVGGALLWVALPQLLLFPIAGYVLRYVDPRPGAAIGLICVSSGCFITAYTLTPLWGSDQFLPTEMMQAVGQSLALTGVVYNSVLRLRLEAALPFGAMLQTARLFGGEIGQSFVTTFQRVREQRASNLIGLHVRSGDEQVIHRLQQYARVLSRGLQIDIHNTQGTALLDRVVRVAATTQSVIDCYVAIGVIVLVGVVLLAFLDAPPGAPSLWKHLFAKERASI